MDFKINQQERDALKGLPHLARLTYLEAIRPYMDYSTGIAGIKRGISYQSLREELYVETQRGNTGGSPSKDQMRRVIKTLERAGLVSIQSEDKRLVLKCELASWDYSAQNLLARRAPYETTTRAPSKNISKTNDCDINNPKAATPKNTLPATPPVSDINNNIFVFLINAFEKFWQMYPVKNSKEKAWGIFQDLSPTKELFQTILNALEKQSAHYQSQKAQGHWMPNWKNPSNWLLQKCWLDEITQTQQMQLPGKNNHARSRQYSKSSTSVDFFWESCKDAFNESNENNTETAERSTNIIDINRCKQRAY
ncbi:MAG: hypothetical protein A3F13_03490 [Gammaproteobacteria bacterium RIFCSPHIGHO2_12_FULL_40_19]|nr:MAG: hypothetical protein A3F13_03490 [Gammaproteobacteria bacterium RIFCSPHIGHO2_12_FULL_40_19]